MPHSVPGCASKTGKFRKSKAQLQKERIIKITFHRLPINPNKRKLWLDSLGIPDPGLNKQTVLCSLHFSDTSFDRTSMSCIRLRDNAVPCIKPSLTYYNEGTKLEAEHQDIGNNILSLTTSESVEHFSMDGVKMENCLESSSIDHKGTYAELCVSDESYSMAYHNQTTRSTSISPERSISLMQSYLNEVEGNRSHSTLVPLEKSLNSSQDDRQSVLFVRTETPQEIHLRKALVNTKNLYRRKIRTLQQKHRRYEKQIAALRDIINVSLTKDIPADEELEILRDNGLMLQYLMKYYNSVNIKLKQKDKADRIILNQKEEEELKYQLTDEIIFIESK